MSIQPDHRKLRAASFVLVFGIFFLALLSVVSDVGLVAYPDREMYGGGAWILIDVHGAYDSQIAGVRSIVKNGWRVGDRFSAASLPFVKRLRLYAYEQTPHGDRLDVDVLRNGRSELLHIPSSPVNVLHGFHSSYVARWIAFDVLGLAALSIAAILVLMRPGIMTWGFYLFVFGAAFPNFGTYFLPLPGIVVFATTTFGYVVQAAGYWGFVQFCARFPTGELLPRARAIVAIAGIAAAFEACWYIVRNSAGVLYPIASLPGFILSDDKHSISIVLSDLGFGAFFVLGIIALALRYNVLNAANRLKVRAVFGALAIYAVYSVIAAGIQHFLPNRMLPTGLDEITGWLSAVYVLIPITTFYAVLHYRVFDVEFVIDRALVYGSLTAILVFALTLIDVVVAQQLQASRIAFVIELVVALGFAFSLEHLREFVEALFRRVLFHAREQSLQSIAQTTQAIQHARKPETVDTILVSEPLEILGLTSAAVFRGTDLCLTQRVAIGWPPSAAAEIDGDARLAVEARAHGGPIRIDDAHVRDLVLPRNGARPAVAIPLMDRHELMGMVFYGGHRNGADIDPDELSALQKLSDSAAHAYEHIDLKLLRDEVAALRAQLEALRKPVPYRQPGPS